MLFLPAERILDHGGDPDVVRVMANLLMEISAKFANLNRKNHLLTEPRLRNRLLIYFKSKNAKKYRRDAEYGSARWSA